MREDDQIRYEEHLINTRKKLDDIRREETLENAVEVEEFYQKIKDKPNVLSSEDVYALCDKYFSTSIWKEKYFLNPLHRDTLPVIFGLKSGICFKKNCVYFINGKESFDHWNVYGYYNISKYIKFEGNLIKDLRYNNSKISTPEDVSIIKDFLSVLTSLINKSDSENEKEIIEYQEYYRIQQKELSETKTLILKELDKDSNNEIDLIENDFIKLLNKNQKKVIEIDKNYIHQFIKISNYIKTKKQNTQKYLNQLNLQVANLNLMKESNS